MLYENMELLSEIVKAGGNVYDYTEEVNIETVEFTGGLLGFSLSEDDGIFYYDGLLRVDITGVLIYLEEAEEPADVIDDILERLERKNEELDLLNQQLNHLKDELEELAVELRDSGF